MTMFKPFEIGRSKINHKLTMTFLSVMGKFLLEYKILTIYRAFDENLKAVWAQKS